MLTCGKWHEDQHQHNYYVRYSDEERYNQVNETMSNNIIMEYFTTLCDIFFYQVHTILEGYEMVVLVNWSTLLMVLL